MLVDVIVCSRYGITDISVIEDGNDAFYEYYRVAVNELDVPLEDISLYTAESLIEAVESALESTGKELIWEQQIQVR